jgi:hypothetical protein
MPERGSRADLVARKAALSEAITVLKREISYLDEDIRRIDGRVRRELTEAFFWEEVFPVLLKAGELTSAALRLELEEGGAVLDDRRFRTFLSRLRSRRWVELKERAKPGLRPVWHLTEGAMTEAKKRIDRQSPV